MHSGQLNAKTPCAGGVNGRAIDHPRFAVRSVAHMPLGVYCRDPSQLKGPLGSAPAPLAAKTDSPVFRSFAVELLRLV